MKIRGKVIIGVSLLVTLLVSAVGFLSIEKSREAVSLELRKRALLLSGTLAAQGGEALLSNDKLLLAAIMDNFTKNDLSMVYTAVIDSEENVIAHSDPRITPGSKAQAFLNEKSADSNESTYGEKGDIFESVTPIMIEGKKTGWAVAGLSKAAIEDAGLNLSLYILVVLCAAVFLGVGFAFLIGTLFVRPIRKLALGAKAIGQGDFEHKIEMKSKDELGELAEIFNKMAEDLQEKQGLVLEKDRIGNEMRIAQRIQNSLLPSSAPKMNNFEVAAYYKPSYEVGGDLYDFIPLKNEWQYGVAVGDVSGKGIPAAMLMSIIRTLLHSVDNEIILPSEFLKQVNRKLVETITPGMFVTLCYAVLDDNKKTINLASAGHEQVYLFAETKVTRIRPGGDVLGFVKPEVFDAGMQEQDVTLEKNELLLLYSDGLVEMRNPAGEEFGDKRIVNLVKPLITYSTDKVIQNIEKEIKVFCGNAQQHDDITLLAIKRK